MPRLESSETSVLCSELDGKLRALLLGRLNESMARWLHAFSVRMIFGSSIVIDYSWNPAVVMKVG